MFILKDYVCNAVNFTILSENTEVAKIIGTHPNSKLSIKDVTKFTVRSQNMQYFPSNFNKVFIKLSKVEIISSNLKKISQLDNLVWLKIRGNDIKFIDEKSFSNSRKMTYLELSQSNIQQIPEKLLSSLDELQEVNFEKNKITTISWVIFTYKINLRIIKLGENKLSKIYWRSSSLNIKALDLHGNECIDLQYPANTLEALMNKINGNCGTEVDLKCDFIMIGSGKHFFVFLCKTFGSPAIPLTSFYHYQ